MKNKVYFKRYLIITLIISLFFSFIIYSLNRFEYSKYREEFNKKISSITYSIKEKYPSVTEEEIIDILNSKKDNNDLFDKYGIDIKEDSVILKNDEINTLFNVLNFIIYFISLIVLILVFIKYEKNKDKKIDDITHYIRELNKRNYKLELDDNTEDELSILKSEIYKTTVMLKESALNSLNDKLELKKSLEDISHQLKTPLTSIIIMLDNIIDNPNMDDSTKSEFIKDIKREIDNINSLVQALLKLSKFDSNTINFNKEQVKVDDIINKAISNVSLLCDLKNVCVNYKSSECKINVDKMWEVEAITNILKNCVEHAFNDSTVYIKVIDNNVYTSVEIKDTGDIIDKEDIKHIFDRFYKCKNSKSDSIGIGLSLSKSIIENDNGIISVSSDKDTIFTVKYFKM